MFAVTKPQAFRDDCEVGAEGAPHEAAPDDKAVLIVVEVETRARACSSGESVLAKAAISAASRSNSAVQTCTSAAPKFHEGGGGGH